MLMELKEIASSPVTVIRPDATLREAAEKMREIEAGALPVCDGDRLVGMITDRDITIRATAEGREPMATLVRDIMTKNVVYCYEDQEVKEAARLMKDRQIRRLVVLDREKNLRGIVSLGDVALNATDNGLVSETLERISEPSTTSGPAKTTTPGRTPSGKER
jgi:CBS domain-containing protein